MLTARRKPAPGSEDPGGYGTVVLPHLDSAYNLARWLTRDAVLAQDVVQDAALRALRYFPTFRGGDGPNGARAWFMQIVRNTALSALASRRHSIVEPLDDAAHIDPAGSPEAAMSRGEQHDRLSQSLAALPLELRECLVLRELEELSYKQIAEVTGVPIGTVMSRLWRARQSLLASSGGDR